MPLPSSSGLPHVLLVRLRKRLRRLAAVVPAAPLSLSSSRRRLAYNLDAGHFSPVGKTERCFQQDQDIYMESTMGGESPGEVL
jgi:hypothetical protein